jgi:uncharacterized OB-fold protein
MPQMAIDVGVAQAVRELVPPIDAAFWSAAREHRFVLQRCMDCGETRFPPRFRCPNCGRNDSEWVIASGRGKVLSYVVVHQRLHSAFDSFLPYAVALVQLDEGPRMLAMVIESAPGDVRVDAVVEVAYQPVDGELVIPRVRMVSA